jgi:hypothetical protein
MPPKFNGLGCGQGLVSWLVRLVWKDVGEKTTPPLVLDCLTCPEPHHAVEKTNETRADCRVSICPKRWFTVNGGTVTGEGKAPLKGAFPITGPRPVLPIMSTSILKVQANGFLIGTVRCLSSDGYGLWKQYPLRGSELGFGPLPDELQTGA